MLPITRFRFRSRSKVFGAGFSPASLFAAGEQGAWYDPSDYTTLFEDSAGTIPITTPLEKPVGLMLDKSGRGNHATQTTGTSRPTLSARYNLLTKTEQFNDSIWLKDAVTVTPDSVSAPNGATTADTLAGNGLSAIHSVRQGTSVAGTRTVSFYAKAGTNSFVQTFTDGTGNEFCNFDLSAGAVGSKGTDTGTATITPVGAGWYRCAATFPVNNATTHIRICLVSSATAARAEANSLATDVYIWGADLRPTNILGQPEYQRVNTATDYDTVGFKPYLKFDGTDDWLTTATITPGTDKAQVFAGVRKLSDAAGYSVLCETSVDVSANNGAIGVQAPRAITSYFSFRSRGTLLSDAQQTGAAYAAPITAVLSGIGDIAADVATVRVNGSAGEITSTADQGTGNYLAYPLYIGRRGGISVPFNGYIYSLVVRFGPNLTGSQISSTETWVANKTGVTL